MNYLLSAVLGMAGITILVWNKTLSQKFGEFYSPRFSATFGKLAHYLGWDDPTKPFNRFMYRGFIITAGIILIILALAAFFGPIYIGSAVQLTA